MKILITEDKRKELAYKMLDNELSQLTRKDINLNKESILSNWQVLFINKNGNIVMRWSEKTGILYVSEDLVIPIRILSFNEVEEPNLIYDWFTNRVRLEPEEVHFVEPDTLNWEDMGLGGLMDQF